MRGIILRYFGSIFSSGGSTHFDEILLCVGRMVSGAMNSRRVLSREEAKQDVFQMDSIKAPSPDGFTPVFFQRYWEIVGSDITAAVESFMHSRRLLRGVNHKHIVLIPKTKCPINMGQLRTISLCNVINKIVSKVFANRLSTILPLIVSEQQGAFVVGRLIHDNVLMSQDVIHHLKSKRRGGRYEMAVKLDMSKAYNRVEWKFVEVIMPGMGLIVNGFSGLWNVSLLHHFQSL